MYLIPPFLLCLGVIAVAMIFGGNEDSPHGGSRASSQLVMDLVSGSMFTVFIYYVFASVRRQVMETSFWLSVAVLLGIFCVSILPSLLFPGATTAVIMIMVNVLVLILVLDFLISLLGWISRALSGAWGNAKRIAGSPDGRRWITSAMFGFAAAIVIRSLFDDDLPETDVAVAENGDLYGVDNDGDGIDETVPVKGFMREGHYVRGSFRAPPYSDPKYSHQDPPE